MLKKRRFNLLQLALGAPGIPPIDKEILALIYRDWVTTRQISAAAEGKADQILEKYGQELADITTPFRGRNFW